MRAYSLWLAAALVAGGCSANTEDHAGAMELVLPGDTYYPESITAAADGTLYVSSVGTGQVLKFAPSASVATAFLPGGDPQAVAGVFADSSTSTLYLCAFLDLSKMPPPIEMRAYDLRTGALMATYAFPVPAWCNDFALDEAGTLFVTDSYGRIYDLPKGTTALQLWSKDPLLAPTNGLAADGIALDGNGNMYVNTFDSGRLLRIPINADGSAGTPTQINLSSPLIAPDGMRALDANTLIVVEGAGGRLTKIVITGDTGATTTVEGSLSGPTSVVKMGDSYWVTEGQLGHFLGSIPGPPSLPFLVRRVPAR